MKKLIFGAVIAAGLTLVGCQERGTETEQQQTMQPGTGGAGEDIQNAEQVEPHTMGGTEEGHPQGQQVVPPEGEAIGGADEEGAPVLQDDPRAEDRAAETQEQMQAPMGDDQQPMQQGEEMDAEQPAAEQ